MLKEVLKRYKVDNDINNEELEAGNGNNIELIKKNENKKKKCC